ncbi:hypothetical protein [Sphingobacterium psychroaquaticum]|uniref:Uncharacterized protein n=1 Tax=Sphingobacterium psychroaquaticum TaxID=561061 RepID=A0A1X7JWK3_9SPHI|nr:hypothetical protein [Sphingobacterium psychroaquaticum]SMG32642.1 hypothetical protein SAMN05660862_2277 [Sphingobacterium psychroaquaticum]
MTLNQVLESEKIEEYKFDGTFLTISDIVDGMICEITFRFDNGKLRGGLYSFSPSSKQKTYDLVWEQVKKPLISKYGNPIVFENNRNLIWNLSEFRLNALFIEVDKAKLVYVTYDDPENYPN